MAEQERSLWPRGRGTAPQWMNGIFYPLIVAVLCAVVVTLQGLREDMAVVKVKLDSIEKRLDKQETSATRGPARRPPAGLRTKVWTGEGARP